MALKEYKEVDSEGNIIETYVLDDEQKVPKNYFPSWGAGDLFFIHKWDFSKMAWVESMDNKTILKDVKETKKKKLNDICKEEILKGFIFNLNGADLRFSYDQEAQRNLSDRWNLFQNDMIDSIRITAHKEDGSAVRFAFNKSEFNKLYLKSIQHKENCISKYRDDLLPLVNQALTVEQVEAVTWDTIVVEPIPSIVVIQDDNTLDKQVEEAKISQAEGDMGILSLLSMMGVLG